MTDEEIEGFRRALANLRRGTNELGRVDVTYDPPLQGTGFEPRQLATVEDFEFRVASWLTITAVVKPRMSPPKSALIDILLPACDVVDAAANMDEMFYYWLDRYGEVRARRYYRWQVVRLIFSHHMEWAISLWERVAGAIRLS